MITSRSWTFFLETVYHPWILYPYLFNYLFIYLFFLVTDVQLTTISLFLFLYFVYKFHSRNQIVINYLLILYTNVSMNCYKTRFIIKKVSKWIFFFLLKYTTCLGIWLILNHLPFCKKIPVQNRQHPSCERILIEDEDVCQRVYVYCTKTSQS